MVKASHHHGLLATGGTVRPVDWRKRMSDHIAYALLVYPGSIIAGSPPPRARRPRPRWG